jgi:hypothetical protein
MENHQVLGATPEKMENIMRDNGAKVENMDKDYGIVLKEIFIEDSGNLANLMV